VLGGQVDRYVACRRGSFLDELSQILIAGGLAGIAQITREAKSVRLDPEAARLFRPVTPDPVGWVSEIWMRG
jgi:hypothetical protein